MVNVWIATNISIICDNCKEDLVYPEDSVMRAHRGLIIYEGSRKHIIEVAESMGWSIKENNHLCKNCK